MWHCAFCSCLWAPFLPLFLWKTSTQLSCSKEQETKDSSSSFFTPTPMIKLKRLSSYTIFDKQKCPELLRMWLGLWMQMKARPVLQVQTGLNSCLGTFITMWPLSGIPHPTWGRQGLAGDLELSCLLRNSLGATSFSSRFPVPRSFFARHRTAMVSSTLAKDTRPSTVLLPRRWNSVMIFETLLAKVVHEVSLLHLERTWQNWRSNYHGSQRPGTFPHFWPCTHLGVAIGEFSHFITHIYSHKNSFAPAQEE